MRSGRGTTRVDTHVSRRVRELRELRGLTRDELADRVGVTYQQAFKYEKGTNRISAGRLHEIARALNAPIAYFYEGLDEEPNVAPHLRMLLEIAQNFTEIQNEKHREAFSQIIRTLAGH